MSESNRPRQIPPQRGLTPVASPKPARRYAQLKPCFAIGSERIRLPVASKIALQIAGMDGGSAGSPSPVGGFAVCRKSHLYLRRRLRHTRRLILVEVGLHGVAACRW